MARSPDIDGEAAAQVLTAVSDAVAAITADASIERVLKKLVTAAQDLRGPRTLRSVSPSLRVTRLLASSRLA